VTNKYVLTGHLVIQTTKPIQSQFVERENIDAKFSYIRAYEEKVAVGQKNKAN